MIHHHGNPGPFGRRNNDETEARPRRQFCSGPWAQQGQCYNFLGEEESGWLTIGLRDNYSRVTRVWVEQRNINWKCPHHNTHAPVPIKVHATYAPTTRAITHADTTPVTVVTKAPTTTPKMTTTTSRPTTPTPSTTHAPVTHVVTMTTEQPSTTADTCIDVVDCEAYGKDYICREYPEAAKVTCRKSCSYC
ncbi:hypothetical protein KP79_PYT24287 [Mizuhopecten yessoensis]|uniref:ShKT domain-containing protein n=2 Tax=Mizuhopecten yessoensis TaxID=6573 RepID=A0A210Q2I1_MIZYE|nr:hypothetical protein KP79_PYT24287 [Mizuhopecten yessoensis]